MTSTVRRGITCDHCLQNHRKKRKAHRYLFPIFELRRFSKFSFSDASLRNNGRGKPAKKMKNEAIDVLIEVEPHQLVQVLCQYQDRSSKGT